jgi:phenylalanine-4-hydroxylase
MQELTDPSPVTSRDIRSHLTRQDWHAYTVEHHDAWAALYARRMPALRGTASTVFLRGADAIGLGAQRIPDLALLNRRLVARTGWSAMPVTGFLPAGDFFHCLAQRRFPTTVAIRPLERLDYTPEPDIFHDVFGHVPLHADPVFADFLQRLGQLASAATDAVATERLARFFWFTVEFGLVREAGEVKLFGSGLISSSAEAMHALSPACERRPFVLDQVLDTAFQIDHLQPVLYVVDGFDELFEAVEALGSPLP